MELLPGKLTPREHERLARLSGWVSFEHAVELLEEFLGIEVTKIVARNYTEAAGAAYVQMQEEEVVRLEREMPEAASGAEKMQISADGAMVPLLHGIWAEVRTLVIGEVESSKREQDERREIHARNLSYFSRKVTAQEFQRLALVEIQRRGVENAKAVAAVMDGADWEQNFVDFHCPQAVRILDFAHAAGHISQIGECVHGEHTPESQAWLKERLHRLKHEGPDRLLSEFEKLQRKHPDTQAISSNLAYLKKRKAQMQYPLFQAQGWPIGSGIVPFAARRRRKVATSWWWKHASKVQACTGQKPTSIPCSPSAISCAPIVGKKNGQKSKPDYENKNGNVNGKCIDLIIPRLQPP